MTDEGFTAEELVQACNKILVYAGLVAKVANVEEVRLVCSSTGLFVAALEGFLQQRLPDAIRAPTTPSEHAYNNIIVVDVLAQILSTDLSHISGERIVEGSVEDISNLLELLAALCHGRPLQGPPAPDPHDDAPVPLEQNGPDPADDVEARPPPPEYSYESQSAEEDATEASVDSASGDSHGDDGLASPRPGRHEEHSDEQPDGEQQRQQQELLLLQQRLLLQLQQQQQQQQQQEQQLREAQQHIASGRAPNVEQQRQAPGRRARSAQRTPRQQQEAAPASRLPLSPIQEVSREGGDGTLAAKETPSAVASRPSRGRPGPAAARRGTTSSGGASSAISIPSDVSAASHRSSHHGGITYPAAEPRARPALPDPPASDGQSDDVPSQGSGSTLTLLELALRQAEATLRQMGHEYEDFYYDDQDAKERRRPRSRSQRPACPPGDARSDAVGSRSSGTAGYKPARRALKAGPWPDGGAGTMQQHKSFLRRAKRALGGGTSTDGSERQSRSSRGRQADSTGGLSSGGSGATAAALRKAAAVRGGMPGAAAAALHGTGGRRLPSQAARDGDGHAALLRTLQSGGMPSSESLARQGRKLLQRTAAAYGAALPLGPPDREEWDMPLPAAGATAGKPHLGMSLSADLESKLRYVYRLAKEHPKQHAARAAVQQLALAEDLLRQVRRREMVDRLSSARARREAALRLTANRLHEQNVEYERRVEQLRLQRLAAEWDARHRSAQMKRALQAELAMREAFLDVLEGEKEVLLAERRRAKEDDVFPKYQSVMRKAEREYLELYNTLENLLAAERQQRVRANREALLAQRQENQLAATVVQERMQELLGRVAREEEAILQRYSIATRPQSRDALVGQIRRLLGLT